MDKRALKKFSTFFLLRDGQKSWAQRPLDECRDRNLGAAERNVEVDKKTWQAAEKALSENPPSQFEHALQKKPMLLETSIER